MLHLTKKMRKLVQMKSHRIIIPHLKKFWHKIENDFKIFINIVHTYNNKTIEIILFLPDVILGAA